MGRYKGFTESRKKANNKYAAEKVENLTVYVPKGKKQILKDAAAERGLSVNKFIIQVLEDALNISLHNDE